MPPPGGSPDGQRIKAPLEDSRGEEKVWFYGALRVRDGHALRLRAPARNTVGSLRLLQAIDQDNPTGELYLVADNLVPPQEPADSRLVGRASTSPPGLHSHQGLLVESARGHAARLFRREALAGQDFCGAADLDEARRVATAQLNRRAKPWVWGRPPPKQRKLRRKFVYRL